MSLPPFAPQNLAAALRVAQADLRVADESLMVERIVIDRAVGEPYIDDKGREQVAYMDVYDGIGLLMSFRPYEQNADVGSATTTSQRVDWHIPTVERMAALIDAGSVTLWAGPVQAGDRARRMTPGKPVKTVRVAGEHDITWDVSQRLVVDDITGGVWS